MEQGVRFFARGFVGVSVGVESRDAGFMGGFSRPAMDLSVFLETTRAGSGERLARERRFRARRGQGSKGRGRVSQEAFFDLFWSC